jgi:CheY-like chemotaxis protein
MTKTKTILCVDDDADDRHLLASEIKHIDGLVTVEEVEDGLLALDYLSDAKQKNRLPCLIVLDLNMPRLDGRQTFKRIQQDDVLQQIPIVVYTSSNNPNDAAYFNNHGVRLITKPMSSRLLPKIAQSMIDYCC